MPDPDLVPLGREHLDAMAPWFDDAETQRWLGGPEWPRIALDLLTGATPQETFRGSRVLRSWGFVAFQDGEPVAYVGGDVYDRGHRVVGLDARGEVVAEPFDGPPVTAAGIAFVVDPAERGRGVGRSTLLAALDHPSLADVRDWLAGVEPDNRASRRLLEACGFTATTREPDAEGIVQHRLLRRP